MNPESSAFVINEKFIKLPRKFKEELRANFIKLDSEFLEAYQESYGVEEDDSRYEAYISSSLAPITVDFMRYLKKQDPDFYGFTNGYDEYGNRLDMIKYFKIGEDLN
jgi:hypothetical protein